MKKLIGIISLVLLAIPTIAQDSSLSQGKAGIMDVAEDDPNMFMFMMLMLLVIVVALLLTVILAMMFWMLALALTFAGILSVSVFMGWYQRSVSAGLLWFVLLTFGLMGIGGGMLIYLLIVRFSEWEYSTVNMFLYAGPAGLLGGILAGWIFLKLMKGLLGFVKGKLNFEIVKKSNS